MCIRKVITTDAAIKRTIHDRCRGFSLIEVIVVMAVLGILAIISIPVYSHFTKRVKVSRCMEELRTLEKDITAYMIDKASLPGDLNDINRGDLRDPWGNPYQYHKVPQYKDWSAENVNMDFDLFSRGKDGISDEELSLGSNTDDDIIRGGNGVYVGTGELY